MYPEIHGLALSVGLTPLVAQIAVIVADIEGVEPARAFIESCRREDEERMALRTSEEIISVCPAYVCAADADRKAA